MPLKYLNRTCNNGIHIFIRAHKCVHLLRNYKKYARAVYQFSKRNKKTYLLLFFFNRFYIFKNFLTFNAWKYRIS